MARKLLLLGLDAVDPTLVRRWMAERKLPAIRALTERGIWGSVQGVRGFFGSTWPSFYTGLSPAGHGFYRTRQLESGSYDFFRPLDTPTGLRGVPFWKLASDAGRRVAVLDVPLTRLDRSLNGMHLVGWGGHDSVSDFRTLPPALAKEVLGSVGKYPLPSDCNAHRRTFGDYDRFVAALERAVERKTALTLELLEREDWDLFLQVFTEAHCAGHQCWHLHDPTHPAHDEQVRAAVGDPLERVYRALDRALGAVVERAGNAHILVFSLHGMSSFRGAGFLFREILYRLGVTERPSAPSQSRFGLGDLVGGSALVAANVLPRSARESLGRVHGRLLRGRSGRDRNVAAWADVRTSRCFAVPNGYPVSTIRLNLAGREPEGIVEPGRDADAFCEALAEDLLDIVDERVDAPLIAAVDRTDALYAGDRRDALPDLLVTWSDAVATGSLAHADGLGATVRARSRKIGLVEGQNRYVRTGEHRPNGFFAVVGPGVPVAERRDPVELTDFHPTICSLLGIPVPSVDGDVVSELSAVRS